MRIEEYPQEEEPVEVEIEFSSEDDVETDLSAALWLLDEAVETFDKIIDAKKLNMSGKLQLELFRVRKRIVDFTNQWDMQNS